MSGCVGARRFWAWGLGLLLLGCGASGAGERDSDGEPSGVSGAGGAGAAGAAGMGASGATAGAGGEAGLGGASGSAGAAGAVQGAVIEITSPVSGAVLRQVPGSPPKAAVHFEVVAAPAVAAVEYRTETAYSLGVSRLTPGFPLDFGYEYVGERWAEAIAFDANGAELGRDTVDFTIAPPLVTGGDCYAELDALGVSYTRTSARGVEQAVHVKGPIGGVTFSSGTSTNPMGDPVACEFVKTLHAFAALLTERGFVRVGTLGSYCYRCCCAWSETNQCRSLSDAEPNCGSSGYSNHSWGRAVDVRYLWKANGTRYDINDPSHFVMASGGTCTGAIGAQTGISLELYQLACLASSRRIFGTTLTPNYNAAHRNHFHMDIGRSGTPSSFITRSLMPEVDVGEHPDSCGE